MASPSQRRPATQRAPPRSRLSRRAFLKLAGAAAAGGAAAACTRRAPSPTPRGSGPVQLVYQDWRTEWFAPMAQQMLEVFHAEHPNIRVFFTPDPEGLRDQMPAAFEAGTAPDVFQGCCDYFPAWAQAGYTLDLAPLVAADLDQATIADWDAAQYKALATRDGQQFGLPKYHGALALYYNKDVFDEYGVDYPTEAWTYAEYAEAMKRLTHDRDRDGQTDLWGSTLDPIYDRVQVHVNAWGGHYVDPADPARCLMAEPQARQAIEWLRARFWDDQVMATSLAVQKVATREAFYTGRLAMVEDGSWALKDILTHAQFSIGVAPLPAGPVRRATLATTDGYGIYAGTRNPEAAWELVKFLTGQEYGRALARTNLLQPARASLVEEWIGFVRNEFVTAAAAADLATFASSHLSGESVTVETFANMNGVRTVTDAAFEEILTLGRAAVAERLLAVCESIGAIQQGAASRAAAGCCA
ncbi:MAG: sugar ABC transporter substrate-binding protein [Anaerolineales bacterium]|nr:sugar ABC transporter substrate-binding protein [Anaerolineales bacterium]